MNIDDISLPAIYKDSADFRFFCKWFQLSLSRIQFDTENLFDLYDALRCPSNLLWMLADTVGFKYDDRLPVAFNRLVILYFMSMIRNRGSKDGVTLAAEVNLAQFSILDYGKENDVLYERLEDTSIPVNSVYVTPHTAEGYIDVVYFSTKRPIDACIEYVRPLGMYLFQHAGVRMDARTKISIDARLTNTNEIGISIGPTHVGHYRREDYSRLQKSRVKQENETSHVRHPVWYRNSEAEGATNPSIDPGYRAMYSLQIANNEHIVKSLMGPIFSLGYGPQDVSTVYPDSYLKQSDNPEWNLRYDRHKEESITPDVYTVESSRTTDILHPRPAVNPRVVKLGDAIALNSDNTKFTHVIDPNHIDTKDSTDE